MALNPQNLINFKDRTPEEKREIAKKGNAASQAAKKRKKELKELLEIALLLPIEEGSEEDNYTGITKSLIRKALDGDTRAYEVIRDTLGQKPKEQVEVSSGDVINIKINDSDKS